MIRPVLIAAAALAPLSGHAAAVRQCDGTASAWNLAEPWEQHSASYAQGAIRVAVLDTIEPAGAPVQLLVLAPPLDEIGARRCRIVSLSAEGSGFYDLDFPGRKGSYDPARGLTLTIPAKRFDPRSGQGRPATLTVTIDQNSGAIAADLVP
ncbi:hypothetical protein [Paracoccus contaminans]|uniref:Uncharacterized protein n=1 Tax=Paracoccus contaminans TaxID=1945662 RepID=A0A1W6CX83_9RHOB|nr:hypothetical protein [Paracoccus contaminans]ARJ69464.1 hypothetical protein B0A89_07325 [Paracoccus contaminans]